MGVDPGLPETDPGPGLGFDPGPGLGSDPGSAGPGPALSNYSLASPIPLYGFSYQPYACNLTVGGS